MFFNLSKSIIVLFVCLSFIGQATASAVTSYTMMHMSGGHTKQQNHVMPIPEHASHAGHAGHNMMSNVIESNTSKTDKCCSKNCSCFASSCSSVLNFIINTDAYPYVNLSSKILSNSALIQSQLSSSLFKPPITV